MPLTFLFDVMVVFPVDLLRLPLVAAIGWELYGGQADARVLVCMATIAGANVPDLRAH